MFWKDFLYICWSWLPALEHGKIEENTVNSGIFNGWGDKGIGSIVEHDVFDRFYGDKSETITKKYRALKETIHGGEKWKFPSLGSPHGGEKWKFPSLGSLPKTWKHIQRTRDLGDYLGVVV